MDSAAVVYRPLDASEAATQTESMERDLIYAGTVGMMDPPTDDVMQRKPRHPNDLGIGTRMWMVCLRSIRSSPW